MGRFTHVFLTLPEQISLEKCISNILGSIRQREAEDKDIVFKKGYRFILQKVRINSSGDKTHHIISLRSKKDDDALSLELGSFQYPEGISFELVYEYIFWRVSQLLTASFWHMPHMPSFEIGNDEKDIVAFQISRRNHLDLDLDVPEDKINLILIKSDGEHVRVCTFYYNNDQMKWLVSCTQKKYNDEETIKLGLEMVNENYPSGL